MDSNLLYFFGIVLGIVILAAIAVALKNAENNTEDSDEKDNNDDTEIYPYTKKQYILSPAEYSFYKALILHMPEQLIIMAKMRVADIIDIEKGLDKSQRSSAWNRIKSKHFDFVILDKKTCTVQSIIELDDSTHNSKKAEKNDTLKNKACEAAGITMHRIPVKRGYTASDLCALIQA